MSELAQALPSAAESQQNVNVCLSAVALTGYPSNFEEKAFQEKKPPLRWRKWIRLRSPTESPIENGYIRLCSVEL